MLYFQSFRIYLLTAFSVHFCISLLFLLEEKRMEIFLMNLFNGPSHHFYCLKRQLQTFAYTASHSYCIVGGWISFWLNYMRHGNSTLLVTPPLIFPIFFDQHGDSIFQFHAYLRNWNKENGCTFSAAGVSYATDFIRPSFYSLMILFMLRLSGAHFGRQHSVFTRSSNVLIMCHTKACPTFSARVL